MYLEGENDFNFIDTYARVVPDDDTGLELRGTFMGGEMQDGILSVDETGALYVSCEVDSDLVDGSISLLANLRHLDDENWTDEDYIPMPESAVEYYRGMTFMEIASTFEIDTSLIPDNGSGDAAAAIPATTAVCRRTIPSSAPPPTARASTASPIPMPPAGRIWPPCRRCVRNCGTWVPPSPRN